MDDSGEREGPERPRPRVVDKRVSSRSPEGSEARPQEEAAPTSPGETDGDPADAPPGSGAYGAPAGETAPEEPPHVDETPPGGGPEPVWTPEQEAEARKAVEEIDRVQAQEWILSAAANLVNVAGVKIDRGKLHEAGVAIDALAGLLEGAGRHLGEPERTLRQLLAQLQMAYAQARPDPPPA